MNSHFLTQSLVRSRFGSPGVNFFISLNDGDKSFIQSILLTSYSALEIDLVLPVVNIFLSQKEITSSDKELLQKLYRLKNSKLEVHIYLNDFCTDKSQAEELAVLKEFNLKEQFPNADQFISAIEQWRNDAALFLLQILSMRLEKLDNETTLLYTQILENLACLYATHSELVDVILEQLLPFLSYKGVLSEIDKLDKAIADKVKQIIVRDDAEQGFLLTAFAKGNIKDIEFLIKVLDRGFAKLFDNDANTFLHLVNNNLFIEAAYNFNPDVNATNVDGNTPLHLAVLNGQLTKVIFLLTKGARTDIKNIKGETFWTIPVQTRNEILNLFRLYGTTGEVIAIPTYPLPQKGYTCGLYATAYVINYSNMLCFGGSADTYIRARRSDLHPSKQSSLRKIAKENKYTKVGEILSLEHLAELIAVGKCSTEKHQIANVEMFVTTLTSALVKKHPVIIPFSLSADDKYTVNTPVNVTAAHLAAIIGIRFANDQYFCLVAHRGGYEEIEAQALFHMFFDMPEELPKLYFYKVQGQWQKYTEEQPELSDKSRREVDARNLTLFRRQFLEVKPPAILNNEGPEEPPTKRAKGIDRSG